MQAINLSVAQKTDLDRSVLGALDRARITDSVTINVCALTGDVEIKRTPEDDPLEFYLSESSRLMEEVDKNMLAEIIGKHTKDVKLIRSVTQSIYSALYELDSRQREYNNSLLRDIAD